VKIQALQANSLQGQLWKIGEDEDGDLSDPTLDGYDVEDY
jgi:hypothetical protein